MAITSETIKENVLAATRFGQRVAEEESQDLADYFVETEQWRQVWRGEKDVILAPKGGGKSAIYSMLVTRADQLLDQRILLAPAENPVGQPAFAEIGEDTSELEFVGVWKLYFLTLIAQTLIEYGYDDKETRKLVSALKEADLLIGDLAKQTIVQRVKEYVTRKLRAGGEGSLNVSLDPTTGMPTGFGGKISFAEPSAFDRDRGILNVDDLYRYANKALSDDNYKIWIVLDRLDVAFASSLGLEERALRALFRVYRDLRSRSHIAVKVFLRSDIWEAVTATALGFREASHFTRQLDLKWTDRTLMQLVSSRLVGNEAIRTHYQVSKESVLADTDSQKELFFKIFPAQVGSGANQSDTFTWCLGRTRDGTRVTAPRELIHLLSAARDEQLRRYEIGEENPAGESLFHPKALRDGLPEVSKVRLQQTIYAEYPDVRDSIKALEGQKTSQTLRSLVRIWNVSEAEASAKIERLVTIGFFEDRNPTYWVPFLYRPALDLVQGSESEDVSDE